MLTIRKPGHKPATDGGPWTQMRHEGMGFCHGSRLGAGAGELRKPARRRYRAALAGELKEN